MKYINNLKKFTKRVKNQTRGKKPCDLLVNILLKLENKIELY